MCSLFLTVAISMSVAAQTSEPAGEQQTPPSSNEVLSTATTTDADLILKGGPIYTGTAAAPTADFVAVKDGRILYAGPIAEENRFTGPDTRTIDLKGAALYPGFTDAHAHLRGIGDRLLSLNLAGINSLQGMLTALKDWADTHKDSPVITGRGWIETHWPEARFPSRFDLDRVVADRPVILVRADGHALVANTQALKQAGIGPATEDPFGGKITRNGLGEATGLLIDAAMGLTAPLAETPTTDTNTVLLAGAEDYAARGWTGLHNMSVSWTDVLALEELAARGALPLRAYNAVDVEYADKLFASGPRYSAHTTDSNTDSDTDSNTGGDHSSHAITRAVKLYMDGALGSRGAALLTPYSDADTVGLVTIQQEKATTLMTRALTAGIQISAHAIGDRGNRLALDWISALDTYSTAVSPRWRIEHAQIIHPDDIDRLKDLGLIASMQPSHAISDLHFAPSRLGDTRLKGAYAWRTLTDKGILIAGGSDAPVEEGSPLIEFYAAVARRDLKGFQGENWQASEVLTRQEALALFTTAPAYASFREKELGTIEAGKLADLTAFDIDLMTVPVEDIPSGQAVLTVVGGKIVHNRLN